MTFYILTWSFYLPCQWSRLSLCVCVLLLALSRLNHLTYSHEICFGSWPWASLMVKVLSQRSRSWRQKHDFKVFLFWGNRYCGPWFYVMASYDIMQDTITYLFFCLSAWFVRVAYIQPFSVSECEHKMTAGPGRSQYLSIELTLLILFRDW